MTEKIIENDILEYLNWVPDAKFWKINTTGIYNRKTGGYQRQKKTVRTNGVSDIIGFHKGRFIALEVKTPKRRKNVSESQQEFIDAARDHWQVAEVVTSVNDVKKVLADL